MRSRLALASAIVCSLAVACGDDAKDGTDGSDGGAPTTQATGGSNDGGNGPASTSTSTSSAGGEGGEGGTSPFGGGPGLDGDVCDELVDCKYLCLNEAEYGFATGMCAEPCGDFDCDESGSHCESFGGSLYCVKTCDELDPASCDDPGLTCHPEVAGGACFRECHAAADCTVRGDICSEDDEDPTTYRACKPHEECTGGVDEDGDSKIDCADPECFEDASCTAQCDVAPTLAAMQSDDTTNGTNGADSSCQGVDALEKIYSFVAPSDGTLQLTLSSATDQGIHVRTACNHEEVACQDSVPENELEVLDLTVTMGTQYWVFVDGYLPGQEGSYTLTSHLYPPTETNCADSVDDDIDDLIDCSDPDCAPTPACTAECTNAPALSTTQSGDTTGGTTFVLSSCGAGGAGKVYSFVPPTNGMLELTLSSLDDQGLVVRLACASDEIACKDVESGGTDEHLALPVGTNQTYYVFVDAYGPGDEGPFTLSYVISPMAEDCTDGIDNDNDFATDCADTECTSDPHCGACVDDLMCGFDDACTCDDCAMSASCGCTVDGVCDQYNENCACSDCIGVAPNCP